MSNYRLSRRAYPTEYWAAHGEEIIATANELHDDKWSFRESRQLMSNGLRTRSFEATGGDLRQVWVHGLAISLVLFVMNFVLLSLASWLSVIDLGIGSPTLATGISFGLAIATLIGMTRSTRWPVLALAGFTAVVSTLALRDTLISDIAFVAFTFLVIGLIARFGKGERAMSPVAMLASTTLWIVAPGLLLIPLFVFGLLIVRLDARIMAVATVTLFLGGLVTVTSPSPDATISDISYGIALLAVAAVLATLVTKSTRSAARRI